MTDESVSTVDRVIAPPSAPEVLVEEAGKAAQNLWWDDRDDSLWWTDVEGGALYRLNLKTRIQSAIYEGPTVGAFIPQEDHSWLLFREKDIALLDFERHAQVVPLIENVRVDGDRFNEAIADAEGRVLVGTVRNGPAEWRGDLSPGTSRARWRRCWVGRAFERDGLECEGRRAFLDLRDDENDLPLQVRSRSAGR